MPPALTANSLRKKSVSTGGCDFAIDPTLDLPDAQVFWLPQADTSVVLLSSPRPALQGDPSKDSPLKLAISADQEHLDGFHTLLPLRNNQRLQLFSLDTKPLAAIIPLTLEGFDRLAAVYRLLAYLHGRSVPSDARLTRQQRARAKRMLQAIDGFRSGVTQQEIAQSLFRTKRLKRSEWQVSPIRHSVMSLLRDARTMISGGYRSLLRNRRKS